MSIGVSFIKSTYTACEKEIPFVKKKKKNKQMKFPNRIILRK